MVNGNQNVAQTTLGMSCNITNVHFQSCGGVKIAVYNFIYNFMAHDVSFTIQEMNFSVSFLSMSSKGTFMDDVYGSLHASLLDKHHIFAECLYDVFNIEHRNIALQNVTNMVGCTIYLTHFCMLLK